MSWPGARRSYGGSWASPAVPGQVASQPTTPLDWPCDPETAQTIANAPTGCAVLQVNLSLSSPMLPILALQPGSFIRSSELPPGAIGDGHAAHVGAYVPAYAPSGIVGGGLFGGGAIGHRVPYHGTLVSSQVGGFTVWEPVPNEPGSGNRK